MLTILIPTISGREAQFEALTDRLYFQWMEGVEIKYYKDNKELTIGAKRQALLNDCDTEYCVMIDDDDDVSDWYISHVMEALKENPDCVTYLEKINTGYLDFKTACHSNKYSSWGNSKDGFAYVRTPFYKDVIRTSIAKQIGFADLRWGEDKDFADRLKASGLIKKEIHIPTVMYIYNAPKALSVQEHKKRYGIK